MANKITETIDKGLSKILGVGFRLGLGTPSELNIARWLLEVRRHSLTVEYYLNQRGLEEYPGQTPHDMAGKGNKLDAPAALYFANHYKEAEMKEGRLKNFYHNHFVLPGIEVHRAGQAHHINWQSKNGTDKKRLEAAGLDVWVAVGENRAYNERQYTGDEIPKMLFDGLVMTKNPEIGKYLSFKEVSEWADTIEKPDVKAIKDLRSPINFDIPEDVYGKTQTRIDEAVTALNKPRYWNHFRGWDLERHFPMDLA